MWKMIRRQYIQHRAGYILMLFPTYLEKDCHAQPCKSGLAVLTWKLIPSAYELALRLAQLVREWSQGYRFNPCIGYSLKYWTWWSFWAPSNIDDSMNSRSIRHNASSERASVSIANTHPGSLTEILISYKLSEQQIQLQILYFLNTHYFPH